MSALRKPRPLSERAIQTHLMNRWRALGRPGTLLACVPNARAAGQAGLTRGLFDLVAIGGNVGCGWLELKTERGSLSYHQEVFKAALVQNNVPYAVAYGLDQAIHVLETWEIIRREAIAA